MHSTVIYEKKSTKENVSNNFYPQRYSLEPTRDTKHIITYIRKQYDKYNLYSITNTLSFI